MSKRNPKIQRKIAKAMSAAGVVPSNNVRLPVSSDDASQESLIKLAIESWRFSRTVARSMVKLDASEASKLDRQFRWFSKQVEETLAHAGLKLVDLEGQEYDPGHAATPLNLDEFESTDELVVVQMLEPVIMGQNGIVSTGTVMLGKASS